VNNLIAWYAMNGDRRFSAVLNEAF